MQWIIEICDGLVGTVNGQGVLGQVISADGKEISLDGQSVSCERCARDFYHDSKWGNRVGDLDSFAFESASQSIKDSAHLSDFFHSADHR